MIHAMTLSIVILQTNKPRDATQCLQSLSQCDLPEETEVILINNGGHEANAKVDPASHTHLHMRMIELPRDGYVYGNNRGYETAQGDIIATVNADITVEKDTFTKLLSHLAQHPEAGIVAPRLFYPDGREQESARRFPTIRELALRRVFGRCARVRPPFEKEAFRPVDWITGAMFIMTRPCYEIIGGHDERFYLFMSDIALCHTAWKNRFAVHQLRNARVTHNESRLSAGSVFSMLLKRTGRAHIKDAFTYFLLYGWKKPR